MQKAEGKQIVMSIAVLALTAIFVFSQYLPLSRKVRSLKADNLRLVQADNETRARLNALPQLYEDIEKLKSQVGDFDAKIPLGRSHGIFLGDLTLVMQKQGLSELAVGPGSETQTQIGGLSQIPVLIRCNGTLGQIFKFFQALEKFDRVIQIEEVDLAAGGKSAGEIAMQAKINIFYRPVKDNELTGGTK